MGINAYDTIIGDDKGNNGIFEYGQRLLGGDDALHSGGIFEFGALAASCPDCRSFAAIEDLGLKCGGVGIASHFAAQCIELVHEMAFGESANGRVAGHSGDGIFTSSHEQGSDAHTCSGKGGFGTGVSATDDD